MKRLVTIEVDDFEVSVIRQGMGVVAVCYGRFPTVEAVLNRLLAAAEPKPPERQPVMPGQRKQGVKP